MGQEEPGRHGVTKVKGTLLSEWTRMHTCTWVNCHTIMCLNDFIVHLLFFNAIVSVSSLFWCSKDKSVGVMSTALKFFIFFFSWNTVKPFWSYLGPYVRKFVISFSCISVLIVLLSFWETGLLSLFWVAMFVLPLFFSTLCVFSMWVLLFWEYKAVLSGNFRFILLWIHGYHLNGFVMPWIA